MTRHAPGHRSHCPISFALDIVGDRWTLLILRDLLMNEKKSYGDLLASEEGIATNILADRLAWLKTHGIIAERNRLYRVTAKGLDLLPMMVEMIAWSAKYDPQTAAPRAVIRQIAKDPAQVVADFKAAYEGYL